MFPTEITQDLNFLRETDKNSEAWMKYGLAGIVFPIPIEATTILEMEFFKAKHAHCKTKCVILA